MKQSKMLYGGLKALGRELAGDSWAGAHYVIIVDENTFEHCLPSLLGSVEALQEAEFVEVPVGEECKTLEVAAQVWQTLLEGDADRDTVIVNLGGGAVCDLGGFVAAGYKRGLRHINVPTTLLAMTDAAIGGKTAIDFGGVKNSIGHFYPAAVTVIEPAFLGTLPKVETLSGMFEMIKTAAVTDSDLYVHIMGADTATRRSIGDVARIKTRVVKADPYDHGIRKILNFGHTFGHAVEVYSKLPHGIAVGIGMKAAMYLSVNKLGMDYVWHRAYSLWLAHHTEVPTYTLKDVEPMLALMRQDKKNTAGTLRCVLLQEPGAAVIDVEVTEMEAVDALLKLGR